MFSLLLAAALAISASDRLALADRLFNRGEYALASAEYAALSGDKTIAVDELAYRLAECARVLKRPEEARRHYQRLVTDSPTSRFADRARLQLALFETGAQRTTALRALVGERVEKSVRAKALYYLGEATSDEACYRQCVEAEPNGPYSAYARLARAALLTKAPSPEKRREAVTQYLEVAFAKNEKLSEEALFMAAGASHAFGRFDEAASLYRRYVKTYPKGARASDALARCAACECQNGKYSDALALCGNGGTEALDFWRMQATYQLGENARAGELARRYLADYPRGAYRAATEDVIARIDYVTAEKAGDGARMVEAARRICAHGGSSADRLRLAWARERNGQTNDAVAAYLDVAAKCPGTADAAEALFRKGCLEARSGNWSAVELSLKEALTGRLDAHHVASAKYLRGLAACRISHEEEGAALLREAVAAGLSLDEEREARLVVADLDYNAGRTNQAVMAYAKLVREGAAVRMSAAKLLAVGRVLPPAEKKICAQALAKSAAPTWRQLGYALLGDAEESLGNLSAAAAAWEKAVAENCETEALASVSVKLGRVRCARGDAKGAAAILSRAVNLTAKDDVARADAYLALAENAFAAGDRKAAKGYATVVTELFEATPSAKAARAILAKVEAKP